MNHFFCLRCEISALVTILHLFNRVEAPCWCAFKLIASTSIFINFNLCVFFVNVFLVSLLVYFFRILQYYLVSYIIKENHISYRYGIVLWLYLHCDFLCRYPIEIFLSIMWKSVATISWFLRKAFHLILTTLLQNSTINFITSYKKLFANVNRLRRSHSVT